MVRDYLERQCFLGPNSDEQLASSTVAIVGLCGGGSPIAQQLAHIGVGHFRLFDHDRADDTNRNRMIGLRPHHVKRRMRKTHVIRDLILGINPNADVQVFPRLWTEEAQHLRDCDAVFGCVDTFTVREQLERYARRFLIPYIDVGMDVLGDNGRFFIVGQSILSLPRRPCMRCMSFIDETVLAREARDYGAAGGRPQVVWPNGALASFAVAQFMSLVTPWNPELAMPLYIEYDGNRLIAAPSRRLEFVPVECPHYPSDGVGDAFWHISEGADSTS